MSIYRARIECCGHKSPRKPVVVIRTFLIEASSIQGAELAALDFAEKTAAIGPKWEKFTMREVCTFNLPCEMGYPT